MTSIKRRIERAEQALGVEGESAVHEIAYFGGGPLPLDEKRGNIIVRHVSYENVRARLEGGARQ